jgi:hypothetical protein
MREQLECQSARHQRGLSDLASIAPWLERRCQRHALRGCCRVPLSYFLVLLGNGQEQIPRWIIAHALGKAPYLGRPDSPTLGF